MYFFVFCGGHHICFSPSRAVSWGRGLRRLASWCKVVPVSFWFWSRGIKFKLTGNHIPYTATTSITMCTIKLPQTEAFCWLTSTLLSLHLHVWVPMKTGAPVLKKLESHMQFICQCLSNGILFCKYAYNHKYQRKVGMRCGGIGKYLQGIIINFSFREIYGEIQPIVWKFTCYITVLVPSFDSHSINNKDFYYRFTVCQAQ